MSIAETYVVQCDHEEKPGVYCIEDFTDSDGEGPGAVEYAAIANGWLKVGNRHYCPRHRAEHEEKGK